MKKFLCFLFGHKVQAEIDFMQLTPWRCYVCRRCGHIILIEKGGKPCA